MKNFVICMDERLCPVCGKQLAMTYYGHPDDIKYGIPENSFSFCYRCNDNPGDILNRVKGILALGERLTESEDTE